MDRNTAVALRLRNVLIGSNERSLPGRVDPANVGLTESYALMRNVTLEDNYAKESGGAVYMVNFVGR